MCLWAKYPYLDWATWFKFLTSKLSVSDEKPLDIERENKLLFHEAKIYSLK